MRQPGYYWVKYKGEWTVAKWAAAGNLSMWIYSGYDFEDSFFEEIDERRIERQLPPVVLRRAFEAGMSAVTYNGRPGYPDAPKFDEWYQKWKDKI